jgi:hypothetical protein
MKDSAHVVRNHPRDLVLVYQDQQLAGSVAPPARRQLSLVASMARLAVGNKKYTSCSVKPRELVA